MCRFVTNINVITASPPRQRPPCFAPTYAADLMPTTLAYNQDKGRLILYASRQNWAEGFTGLLSMLIQHRDAVGPVQSVVFDGSPWNEGDEDPVVPENYDPYNHAELSWCTVVEVLKVLDVFESVLFFRVNMVDCDSTEAPHTCDSSTTFESVKSLRCKIFGLRSQTGYDLQIFATRFPELKELVVHDYLYQPKGRVEYDTNDIAFGSPWVTLPKALRVLWVGFHGLHADCWMGCEEASAWVVGRLPMMRRTTALILSELSDTSFDAACRIVIEDKDTLKEVTLRFAEGSDSECVMFPVVVIN